MSAPEVMDTKLRRMLEEEKLGKDIIDECRVQLMLKFRFLDLALWRMDLKPMRVNAQYPLATDGKWVVYDPGRVIGRFQESFEESVRDYLHLVMHCIFRHPYNKDHDSPEAWNLACDIIVENAVIDMCGTRFVSPDDAARKQAVSEIQMLMGSLTPSKVYSLIKGLIQTPPGQQFRGLGRSVLNEWHALFERDDHGAWPANSDPNQKMESDDKLFEEVTEDNDDPDAQADSLHTELLGENEPDDQNQANEMNTQDSDVETEGENEEIDSDAAEDDTSDDKVDDDGGDAPPDHAESNDETELEEKEWEEISKQIEMNLETFAKEWGEEAGSLMSNLAIANRKRYSYTDFLRQFMAISEEMQLNMDEFDYIYYTYGIDLYGNMPLIEPLEYKETERVHDFVVAIDTSESVSGELVVKFITHTFDILKSSEDYTREVNIHIIQCDARVQSDIKIKDLKDVDRMMEGFQVRGFGGTDFRPAFDYVEMLRYRGELQDMKGMIYFTDGLGQFPEKTPDYDVAFVFMDDEGKTLPPVPPWAMKIVIDEAGINRLKTKTGKGERA